METYPLDIAPEQVVHWLLDEERVHAFDLFVRALRAYQPAELRGGKSRRLSEEDRAELSDIVEVGLLEVTPGQHSSLWTLRVRVEDDIGERLPEDEAAPAGEEEIDLIAFDQDFIQADRGVTYVSVEVAGPAAKASFERVLNAMRTDRHGRKAAGKEPRP